MLKLTVQLLLLGSALAADTEEAPYTVVKDYEGWQERVTPALKWVSTDASDRRPNGGSNGYAAFYRLFDYIDGGNSEGMKIAMTSPVTHRIIPSGDVDVESNFTMSFFIPMSLQDNPPLPLDELVYIEERPELRIATRTFGGFPNDAKFTEEALALYELTLEEGLAVVQEPLWTAGYDGPGVFINRRNEVWLEMNPAEN